MKIFKYGVPVNDKWVSLDLPVGSQVVHVGLQGDYAELVYLWVLVNPEQDYRERRSFRVFGTGQEIEYGAKYVGTCIWKKGALVWHVFER